MAAISCGKPAEPARLDYLEIRIHRWTALEGGEIFVMRKVGSEWSAMLLGDGERFSCLYQKHVSPKSDWNDVWRSITELGVPEFKSQPNPKIEDGSGFIGEIMYEGKLTRFTITNPDRKQSRDAARILDLSDIISREFQSPVFLADYDRGIVGAYLINTCRDFRAQVDR
jgi:hypothetical protein